MLEPKPGENPPPPNNPAQAPQKDYNPTDASEADGFTPGTQNPDDAKKDE